MILFTRIDVEVCGWQSVCLEYAACTSARDVGDPFSFSEGELSLSRLQSHDNWLSTVFRCQIKGLNL